MIGLGLGLAMQVLVPAAQNAVDYRNLGVATSGTTLFRSIGGLIGGSVGLTSEVGDSLRVGVFQMLSDRRSCPGLRPANDRKRGGQKE